MKSRQKGNSAVVIIIIVLVLVAIGGAGFFLMKRGGKLLTNTATTIVSTAASQKAYDDCKKEFSDEDLCKALSNFTALKQYQTTMTMSGTGAATYIIELDNGKTYMKQTYSGKSLETITIDNVHYTKDNTDGKWWKQVLATATKTTADDYKFDTNIDNTTTKTTYTKVGQEACDKLTCIKYKVTETGSKETQYIWVDTKDHLMRKWSTESADGSKTEATYSYNKKSVDAPGNTKDASPTQNVTPADFTSAMMGAMGSSGSGTTTTGSNSWTNDNASSSGSSNDQSATNDESAQDNIESDN